MMWQRRAAPLGLIVFSLIWILSLVPVASNAAPYAAMVIDARSGKVLHSRNADTRLHPASLTKMMTLYIAFQAIERGEISLDTRVRISRHAASEPPSKLGLRAGQQIALRYLIRAAAIKSANDAATAIGEAISGSEADFARRMNRTAQSLGMTRTNFKNAHGLTQSGHLSTARDMTTLGRHLLYDYPEYYNLFSRRSTDAGIATVANTNRRLLAAYRGADGIKTGYTRAAGFNLVASAERGRERIIATMFGGQSGASRNARVAELLDMGFDRAPTRVRLRKPRKPAYVPERSQNAGSTQSQRPRKMTASLRPVVRPAATTTVAASPGSTVQVQVAEAAVDRADVMSALQAAQQEVAATEEAPQQTRVVAVKRPAARPRDIALTRAEPEVVTRFSTSGSQHWGVNVGRFGSRHQAEKALLQTALMELGSLDGSLRKVVQNPRGFDATFMGLTQERADLACRRLAARNVTCFTVGPSS